jgi:DNA primase small subunit
MFQYCYPRLDIEVTKGLNHLLKSPFCIHPKTGRVCVPIDIDKVDTFDPFKVPSITELSEQLERIDMINIDKKIKGN